MADTTVNKPITKDGDTATGEEKREDTVFAAVSPSQPLVDRDGNPVPEGKKPLPDDNRTAAQLLRDAVNMVDDGSDPKVVRERIEKALDLFEKEHEARVRSEDQIAEAKKAEEERVAKERADNDNKEKTDAERR